MDYNSLLASTIKHYQKGFANNVIRDFIFLAALGDKDLAPKVFGMRKPEGEFADGIKLVSDPGVKIFMPIMTGRNVTINSYSGYDTLDITPSDPFNAAEFDWKSIAGSVNIDNERLDMNSGDAVKLFDLMTALMENLKVSFQENLNDRLLRSCAPGSKDPWGLFDIVQDNPAVDPQNGPLGGISGAANPFWRNQTYDLQQGNAGFTIAFGNDQTGPGHVGLRKMLRDTTFGTEKANLILGGEYAFDKLENSLMSQVRYISDKEKMIANVGFQAIMFKGVPVVMEKRISALRAEQGLPGDAFYAINTKYMKLWGMKNRWFQPSKVKEPVNQDTNVQHIITRCQLATDNRRSHGVMFNIPTT